ncbi:MAG: response regulator [Janthinobacterium lividum]
MRRVLIIDDEDDIREVVALALETVAGWNVITAPSGSEGITAAQREHPDAILMDVMMLGMDGPATFRQMQTMDGISQIPVVFLTAKVQGTDRKRFEALGVAAVLAKPFDPLTLANELSQALGWHSAVRTDSPS